MPTNTRSAPAEVAESTGTIAARLHRAPTGSPRSGRPSPPPDDPDRLVV